MENKYLITKFNGNPYWRNLNCITKTGSIFSISIPYHNQKKQEFNMIINGLVVFLDNLKEETLLSMLCDFSKNNESEIFELPLYIKRDEIETSEESFQLQNNIEKKYSKIDLTVKFGVDKNFSNNDNFIKMVEFQEKAKIYNLEINKYINNIVKELEEESILNKYKYTESGIEIRVNKKKIRISINDILIALYEIKFSNKKLYDYLNKNVIFYELVKRISKRINEVELSKMNYMLLNSTI